MVDDRTKDGQTHVRVFLSYSRIDQPFAIWLREELERLGVEVFRDVDDTLPGELWWQRLQDLIARADAVVFVLSPNSVQSSVCGDEVVHAQKLNKRIFPIAIDDIDWAVVPEGLSRVHSVSFTDTDARPTAVSQLYEAFLTDIDWVREHTRLRERADLWEKRGRSRHELLRGRALNEAEAWLDAQPEHAEPPTALHREFFQVSRDAARQRRTFLTGGLVTGLLVAVTLAGLAFWQRNEAQIATVLAQTAKQEAERQEEIAKAASVSAQTAQLEAERQEGIAVVAKIDAESSEAETRRTAATSLFVRASREITDGNTPEALAFLSRAVQIDPEFRSARLRMHSLLTARRHAVPLVTFSISQKDLLAPPQFHSARPHFYDGERTWDLDSLDLVKNAVDLSWVYHRTVARRTDEAVLILMPEVSVASKGSKLLLTDASRGTTNALHVFSHEGPLTYFEFSHTGKLVVSSSADGAAKIWSVESGELIGAPLQHDSRVTMATFSRDDSRILTTSADNSACLWNASTTERIGEPLLHQGDVLGGNFSPDGHRFVTWTAERAAFVWLTEPLGSEPVFWFTGFRGNILDARFNGDGTLLALALTDGTARIFDIGQPGQPSIHCEPVPHGSPVRWVGFEPNGNRFATAGKDAITRVWQLPERRDQAQARTDAREVLLTAHGRKLELIRDSLDSQQDIDGDRVIDADTGETIAVFEELPRFIAISPSGRYLLDPFGGRMFDTTGGESFELHVPDESALVSRMEFGRGFEFSPDETRLLTLHRDHVARIWKLPGGEHLLDIKVDSSVKLPAVAGAPAAITVDFTTARWSPDAGSVAIVSRSIELYEAASGDRQFVLNPSALQSMTDMPVSVAFAPTGDLIVGGYTAMPQGRFQIWNSKTGKSLGFPLAQGVMVRALAFTRDATRLVVGSGNGAVRVYDVDTREPLTDFMLAGDQVRDVCFSSDESLVLVATRRAVQAWDIATARPVTDWIFTSRRPFRIRPTPDDTHMSVEYENGSCELFAIDWPRAQPGTLVKHAELATALAGLYLTADTNVMQPLNAFEVLSRLRTELPDTPALAHLQAPHFKAWSLNDWIDSHPQPASLQELKLLSLRLPPVPLSQARLAVMWANFKGETPEETTLSKTMAQHNAGMAQTGPSPDPRTYYYLSRYYQLTGNVPRARSMAERALEYDTSSERFRDQLQSVNQMLEMN